MKMVLKSVNRTQTLATVTIPIEGVAHVPSALQHATVGMVT